MIRSHRLTRRSPESTTFTEYSIFVMLTKKWGVEFTAAFEEWWQAIDARTQAAVDAYVTMLEERGPTLGYPYSSKLSGSRHRHMRELRVQSSGRPLRVLYAFDPRRVAVLLVGGDKTGDDRFYERLIRQADRLYDEHLATLPTD